MDEVKEELADNTTTQTKEGTIVDNTKDDPKVDRKKRLVDITSTIIGGTAVYTAIGADMTKCAVVKGAKETKTFTKEVVVPVGKDIGAATKASVKAKWAEYKAKRDSKSK